MVFKLILSVFNVILKYDLVNIKMSNKICVIGFGIMMFFIFFIVEYVDKLMGFFF